MYKNLGTEFTLLKNIKQKSTYHYRTHMQCIEIGHYVEKIFPAVKIAIKQN